MTFQEIGKRVTTKEEAMFKRMLEKLSHVPPMPDALLFAVIGFELGFVIAAAILGY